MQALPVLTEMVDLELEAVNKNSVIYINRGYDNEVYFDTVRKLKNHGIEVVTHLILGLPNESAEDMIESTRQAILAGTDGIKFQLLHVLENTKLADDYRNGFFDCLTIEEYASILKRCIALLPSNVVVHRITGDGPKSQLIAPLWSTDKKRVLNYLNKFLSTNT